MQRNVFWSFIVIFVVKNNFELCEILFKNDSKNKMAASRITSNIYLHCKFVFFA